MLTFTAQPSTAAKLIPQLAALLGKWPSATSYAERLALLKSFAEASGIVVDTMPDASSSLQRRPRFVADDVARTATLVLLAAIGSKLPSGHSDELRKQATDLTYSYKADRERYARVDRNWGRLANVPHWVLVPASTKASRAATIESRGDADWASILGASFGLAPNGSPLVAEVTPAPVTETTAPAVAETTAPAVAETTAPAVAEVTPAPVAEVTAPAVTIPTPADDSDLPSPPKRRK